MGQSWPFPLHLPSEASWAAFGAKRQDGGKSAFKHLLDCSRFRNGTMDGHQYRKDQKTCHELRWCHITLVLGSLML